MTEPRLQTIAVNGINVRVAIQGVGPLVVMCHGFPESWLSWRSQLAALAAAGYRAVAPDMRGYGGTDAPPDVSQYTLLHLVGDVVGLVHALGEKQAVVVGHDWGSIVAWNAALLRPDLFRAVVGMSVPFSPPGATDLLSALDAKGIKDFYIQYFQSPGVAEAELEADVGATMRLTTCGFSGDGGQRGAGMLDPGKGFLSHRKEPAQLPEWLNMKDLYEVIAGFQQKGFRGPLNWYRNFRVNWELMQAWRGAVIRQPSLFIAGSRDDVVRFPASQLAIERFPQSLPGLRGSHMLEDAGHWIQRQRAAEVNGLLLDFLKSLPA